MRKPVDAAKPVTSPLRGDALSDVAPSHFSRLSSADLYITARCNRRCTHCFLPSEYFESGAAMSLETAAEIMTWCRRAGVGEVTFLGGEPSLHPRFADLLRTARAHGFFVRVVTNGGSKFRALLEGDTARHHLDRVSVSLDGPTPEIVDGLRGNGAFRDAMQTISLLRRHQASFDINFTVTRLALNSIEAMIELAEATGCRRLNMHWLSPVGRARSHPELSPTEKEWYQFVRSVMASSPKIIVDCEVGFLFPDVEPEPGGSFCATRDRANLQFFPDGRVFSCGLIVESSDLHGYEWSDGRLRKRAGDTELSRTRAHCHGCPIRINASDLSPGARVPPACIYSRVVRGRQDS